MLNSSPKATQPQKGWSRMSPQVYTTVNPRHLTLLSPTRGIFTDLQVGFGAWLGHQCGAVFDLVACLSISPKGLPSPSHTLSPWAVTGCYLFTPPADPFSALFHSVPGLTCLVWPLWTSSGFPWGSATRGTEAGVSEQEERKQGVSSPATSVLMFPKGSWSAFPPCVLSFLEVIGLSADAALRHLVIPYWFANPILIRK